VNTSAVKSGRPSSPPPRPLAASTPSLPKAKPTFRQATSKRRSNLSIKPLSSNPKTPRCASNSPAFSPTPRPASQPTRNDATVSTKPLLSSTLPNKTNQTTPTSSRCARSCSVGSPTQPSPANSPKTSATRRKLKPSLPSSSTLTTPSPKPTTLKSSSTNTNSPRRRITLPKRARTAKSSWMCAVCKPISMKFSANTTSPLSGTKKPPRSPQT